MSELYTSYNSERKEKEHIYATWDKSYNTWGKSEKKICEKKIETNTQAPLKPLLPPLISRTNKPSNEKLIFREGIIEVDY